MNKTKLFLGFLIFTWVLAGSVFAAEYPQVGVMTCGDLWDTFAPTSVFKAPGESNTDAYLNTNLIRFGCLERQWTTPTKMYPSGSELNIPWGHGFTMTEYSKIENFNNFTRDTDARAKQYINASYLTKLAGVVASNADNKGGVPWKSSTERNQMVYEASFPTNIGVDVKMRVRAYTCNEANMNDWIALELQLTNTGNQDTDGNGVYDRTNHDIQALTLIESKEIIGSMFNNTSGNRWNQSWAFSRMSGYDGSPDVEKSPWDATFEFDTNVDQSKVGTDLWAPDGDRKIGYRDGRGVSRDMWDGCTFIAVKQGPMEAGAAAPDKKTIYDSHPIGTGVQRGWYTSSAREFSGGGVGKPYLAFLLASGTFYADGGRSWQITSLASVTPDPNYFDITKPYTAGDPLSFVACVKPEAERGQPLGDMKYTRKWLQNWEKNFPGKTSPAIPDADTWTDGGMPPTYYNFDGNSTVGVGPFALKVGETMTAVWVEYAGYRLSGIRQSLKTARYAYEKGWALPTPPPMPDMNLNAVQNAAGEYKTQVVWNKVAESATDFAGYKVYRTTAYPKVNYELFGNRFLDLYHHQTAADIGATDPQLVERYSKPLNPNFSRPSSFRIDWDANPSGPWKLVAYIPKADLAKTEYVNTGTDKATYPYQFVDGSAEVKTGYTYWYYVAAFDNETGTVGGVSFTSLESGKDNWNGRDGRWYGCYHFASGAAQYPTTDLVGKKYLGANFVLQPPRVTAATLQNGIKKIMVKPNPYKVQAPHDVGLEHKIQFYNLTADTRITILDLSGQIMEVLEYEGTDPTNGAIFWDMFTKDGPEVSSGLYIWLAEYPGGQQKGYLAIQR